MALQVVLIMGEEEEEQEGERKEQAGGNRGQDQRGRETAEEQETLKTAFVCLQGIRMVVGMIPIGECDK